MLDVTLGQLLRQAALEVPDRIALVEGSPDAASRRRWTYAQLLTEAERVASALLGRFRPGDRIAIWAPNIPEWELLQLGASLAGMVLVTVNPAFKTQELTVIGPGSPRLSSGGGMALPFFGGSGGASPTH